VSRDSIIDAVSRYYTGKVSEHGPTPRGVDWRDSESQGIRFAVLLDLIAADDEGFTLNDYGCGYGALFDVLAARGHTFKYFGYDVSEAMIAQGQAEHAADPRASFTSDARELQSADYTIASGIFNVRLDHPVAEWRAYVLDTIDQLARLSRRGLAFNALTSHADPPRMRDDLYYADPAELFDYCLRRHARDVVVRHDYPLYEFTVIVHLDGRPPVETGESAV
jgi:SAM-dependent methyltransferase